MNSDGPGEPVLREDAIVGIKNLGFCGANAYYDEPRIDGSRREQIILERNKRSLKKQ